MQDNVRILYNHDSAGNVLPTSSVTEISGGTYGGITNYGVLKGGRVGSGGTADGHNTATLEVTTGSIFSINTNATIKNFTINSINGSAYTLSMGNNSIIENCTINCRVIPTTNGNTCNLAGTIKIGTGFINVASSGYCTYKIAEGAIIDMRGAANTTPISPTGVAATTSGAVIFSPGGATVLYSSGTVAGSYMMDNVTLPAGATMTNSGSIKFTDSTTSARISGLISGVILEGTQLIWINLTGSAVDTTVESGATINVSAGRTITNTTVSSGGRVNAYGTVNGGTIASGGQMRAYPAAGLINNVTVLRGGAIYVSSGGTANEPIISSGGAIRVFSGGTALLVTSNTGATITAEDGSYITYK